MSAQMQLDLRKPSGRFYQTTRLTPDELNAAIASARFQDEAILALFRRFESLTPSRAWTLYKAATGKHETPLTSVRRAISTLTDDGFLRKTDEQKLGPLGKS